MPRTEIDPSIALHCAYCKMPIPKIWMKDKFVVSWRKHVRKNEDGTKFIVRVPNERVCRRCYFKEVKTNKITQRR